MLSRPNNNIYIVTDIFTMFMLQVDSLGCFPCLVLINGGAVQLQLGPSTLRKMLEMCGLIDDPELS